jgi:phage terminase large subunit-like protein
MGSSLESAHIISDIIKYNRILFHRPYGHPETFCNDGEYWKANGWETWSNKPWQTDFHNAGATNKERMTMCANGTGKSISGAYETAIHLTGMYPDWWEGARYNRPIKMWIGSIDAQMQRETVQNLLLGSNLTTALGTGYIPRHALFGKPKTKQAGMAEIVDVFQVKHTSGGYSTATFKTYQQGWRSWQGAAPDIIWLDEEPNENDGQQKGIFSEAQTRVFRTSGHLYATLTPLLGETAMARHFMDPQSAGIWWTGATWDDAPHLKKEDKDRLAKTYPEHEAEARMKGVPMMGEGRVFTVSESEIVIEPMELPKHWARIAGIDFGIDHPAASSWLAWDRDSDTVYLYDCYKKKNEFAPYHAAAMRARGLWIPVAWPHDGMNREKSGGVKLHDSYRQAGVTGMLGMSARYEKDKGGGQPVEPIIYDLIERMKTGRFKVFSTCSPWLEEFRNYYRKDGQLKKTQDDALKSSFYALMMLRYAASEVDVTGFSNNMPSTIFTMGMK